MESFQQFYTDHRDKLFGYLLQKSGNSSSAADLVQDTFTRYLERYGRRDGNLALLFTIGRNLFYDQVRRQKFRWSPLDPETLAGANLEETFIAEEQLRRVQAALSRLSEEERDILALVVNSDLGYREIAKIHGCSAANIKVKVHRARQKLKKTLKEGENG